MSRYEIPTTHIHHPKVNSIIVGWDRPLKTFFIQVHIPHPIHTGETTTILHEGCDLKNPLTINAIKLLIRPFGTLPPDIENAMKTDQANSISNIDGPAQAHMKDLIRRLFDYED